MSDWSQNLLFALGGGILTVAGMGFGIKYAYHRFLSKLLLFDPIPPARITAGRLADPAAHLDHQEWAPWAEALREANYHRLSNFGIPEVPGLLCSPWLGGPGRTAVLYSHPRLGGWWDLSVFGPDRTSILVTSNPTLSSLPSPPFCFRTVLPEARLTTGLEILEREFQSRRTDFTQLPTFTEETFLLRFVEDYADHCDWRNAHQRPTKEDVREQLLAKKSSIDDEAITEHWTWKCEQMIHTLEAGLRERFETQQRNTNRLAYRSRDLVCVHDALTSKLLLESLEPFIDEKDREQYEAIGLPPELENAPLSQGLELLNALLPEGFTFELVGAVEFPLLANFYLAPRGQIPIDLFPHKPIPLEDS